MLQSTAGVPAYMASLKVVTPELDSIIWDLSSPTHVRSSLNLERGGGAVFSLVCGFNVFSIVCWKFIPQARGLRIWEPFKGWLGLMVTLQCCYRESIKKCPIKKWVLCLLFLLPLALMTLPTSATRWHSEKTLIGCSPPNPDSRTTRNKLLYKISQPLVFCYANINEAIKGSSLSGTAWVYKG